MDARQIARVAIVGAIAAVIAQMIAKQVNKLLP